MAGGNPRRGESKIQPGSGRRHALPHPKGRVVDPEALDEVRNVLGDRPRRRDLLIEHLHLIQDRYHRLSVGAPGRAGRGDAARAGRGLRGRLVLRPLRHRPRRRARPAGDRPSESATASRVPWSGASGCSPTLPAGSTQGRYASCVPLAWGGANVRRSPSSARGPSIEATVGSVVEAVAARRVGTDHPHRTRRSMNTCDGRLSPAARLPRRPAQPRRSGRDRSRPPSCAGWAAPGSGRARSGGSSGSSRNPGCMAINADEGEPGTFKDRYYLEREPHRVLEGMLVAAWVVEAAETYIYLRDEYPHIREILRRELARLEAGGAGRHRRHTGDSPEARGRAYICGEESAMLESIEGKRGLPRHKPPFPAQVGLFGRPTLINNVETVYWVRAIVERGPDWFKNQGRNGRHGLRSFSVSGRVKEPGVKLAPAGITARQLIDEYCGGMADGHAFRGYLPGGASGGILPASLADIPLDFGTLEPHGCFIGSAAVVVLSDRDDPRAVALNLMRFFEDESCGQCTPCRCGTEKAVKLMECAEWDEPLLNELSAAMRDASICGLGQAAPNPLLSVLKYFRGGPPMSPMLIADPATITFELDGREVNC